MRSKPESYADGCASDCNADCDTCRNSDREPNSDTNRDATITDTYSYSNPGTPRSVIANQPAGQLGRLTSRSYYI